MQLRFSLIKGNLLQWRAVSSTVPKGRHDRAAVVMEAMMTSGRATAAADRIAAQEFMAACMDDVFEKANT